MVMTVLCLCLLPAPDIEPVARLLPDKVEHAIAFFGMTLWYCGVYPRRRWPLIVFFFLLLGAAIEVAQGEFTATRAADVRDWMADAAGIGSAALVARAGVSEWARWLELAWSRHWPRS